MPRMTRAELEADYDRTAREYLARLQPEHFMEAVPQATQRSIFTSAFEQIHTERADVHPFSELLIQYAHGRPAIRRQVVPDNLVVLHAGQVEATTSYAVATQPGTLLMVLEYVSKGSVRKDYEDSFWKYERELKVPYYLLFYPDNQEMTLFKRGKARYAAVPPDDDGRCPIPEIEVHSGLLEGWVRFWFRGELMPRPGELRMQFKEQAREIAELRRQLAERREGGNGKR